MFFIYIIHITWTWFLPICGLSFHFLNSMFWSTKALILRKSNFLSISFFWLLLLAYNQKLRPIQRPCRFSPLCSFRGFIVLAVTYGAPSPLSSFLHVAWGNWSSRFSMLLLSQDCRTVKGTASGLWTCGFASEANHGASITVSVLVPSPQCPDHCGQRKF